MADIILDLLQWLLWFSAVIVLATGAFVSYRIATCDKFSYQRSKDRSPGFIGTMKGQISLSPGAESDFMVRAGIAIDRKSDRWITQGKLSEDIVDELLKK